MMEFNRTIRTKNHVPIQSVLFCEKDTTQQKDAQSLVKWVTLCAEESMISFAIDTIDEVLLQKLEDQDLVV